MNKLLLALKNRLKLKYISSINGANIYKKAMADYIAATCKINANLICASEVFNKEYDRIVKAGNYVNDLRVLEQNGVNLKVQDPKGRIFHAVNLATNSYNDLDLEQECRNDLVTYVKSEELSSCLSRKVAGLMPAHLKLENELCDFLNYKECILSTSGYIAQISTIFALFREGDIVFSDQHNHSSLIDGMQLSKAKIVVYPHLNYIELEKLLKKYRHKYNCAGIISDGVFSAHGTMANLDKLYTLKNKYNCITVIDDTHGFGTIGKGGRGIIDYYKNQPDILTASMAKALAGFGGFIVANSSLIKVIDCFGRQNINTSHLSPINAAHCLINLKHYRKNFPNIYKETIEKISFFNIELEKHGIKCYNNNLNFIHPIFSFYKESEREAIESLVELYYSGVIAAFFPPPISPFPTIRFSLHRKIPNETLVFIAEFLAKNKFNPISKPYWDLISDS